MIGRALRAFERFVDATGRIAEHVKSIDDSLGTLAEVRAAELLRSSSYTYGEPPQQEANDVCKSVAARALWSRGCRVPS